MNNVKPIVSPKTYKVSRYSFAQNEAQDPSIDVMQGLKTRRLSLPRY